MRDVTIIHGTARRNLPAIMAVGLLVREPDQALGTIAFDITADKVAREMGIPERRTGRVFATLPHWQAAGVGWISRMAFVAFEVDGMNTYAFNADIVTSELGPREYWDSRRTVIEMISIPEPGENTWEIIVQHPIPPHQVRTYKNLASFWKAEGNQLRQKGYLPPDPDWLGPAPAW